MAIPERALAPGIRPAGRLSPALWWLIGVCEMIEVPAYGAIFQFDNPRRPRDSTHKLPGAVRNVVNASTLFSARSSRNPFTEMALQIRADNMKYGIPDVGSVQKFGVTCSDELRLTLTLVAIVSALSPSWA